jgi:hypothetical protein
MSAQRSTDGLAAESVGFLVRKALGRRADFLSGREFSALVRKFASAGRTQVLLEAGSARDAADAVARASITLSQARRVFAVRTRPGYRDCIIEPPWSEAHRALEKHRRRLERYDEVVGYGLSYRRREGKETDEKCVLVLVPKKLSASQLRKRGRKFLPKRLSVRPRKAVPVDVIEVGKLKRQVLAGTSIGPRRKPQIRGTIGSFAVDLSTGTDVALTAMHVRGSGGVFTAPSLRDDVEAADIGHFLDGTMQGIDAAKVSVESPATAERSFPEIGPIRGWRPLTFPGDRGTRVHMFGAASGQQTGFIIEAAVSIPSEDLDMAILVDIESAEGDSGGAIVDDDNLVLGLLAGQMNWDGFPVRVFSPISSVLRTLGCDF